MIVGSGMIAQALEAHAVPDDVVIFASGEANSRCTDADRFGRELQLLREMRDSRLLVYFSTISALHDKKTPYTAHKLAMEEVVRSGPHIILRLANLVGPNQARHQLIPALVAQVRGGTVTVHENSARDLLDVADLARMLPKLIESCPNETINVLTGYYVPVDEIVGYIARLLRVSPEIHRVKGVDYPVVSVDRLTSIIDCDSYGFGPTYYQTVLNKYVTQD